MFLYVENAGEIPLSGIRLLGLSKKSQYKIGQFGTGLKEAIALCLRKNITIMIHSGIVKIEFAIQKIDGQDEVCLIHNGLDSAYFPPKTWIPMGFSPNLGKADWNSEWQILREIFCNAIDEGGLLHNETTSPWGTAGCTRVFVELTAGIAEEYAKLAERLIPFTDKQPVIKTETARAYERMDDISCRIYCKGVYIQEHSGPHMFDYEFDNLELTESRTADWYWVHTRIGSLLGSTPEMCHSLIKFSQTDKWKGSIEEDAIGYFNSWEHAPNFQKAWAEFGLGALACSDQNQAKQVGRLGGLAITVPSGIYSHLKKMNCPVAGDSLGGELLGSMSFGEPDKGILEEWEGVRKKFVRFCTTADIKNVCLPEFKMFHSYYNCDNKYVTQHTIAVVDSIVMWSNTNVKELLTQCLLQWFIEQVPNYARILCREAVGL